MVDTIKNGAVSLIGLTTLAYGAWNGIVYGIQWTLHSKDESHKAQLYDVLKDVGAPIVAGTTILIARYSGLDKR